MDIIQRFQGENRFLSNFAQVTITVGGIEVPSTEHGYQMCKTLDIETRKRIANHPFKGLKKFARTIELRGDWDKVKVPIMYKLLAMKFEVWKYKDKLIKTGDSLLIEGNTWGDNFWGVPIEEGVNLSLEDCRLYCSPAYEGNHLGKLLMLIRDRIRLEIQSTDLIYRRLF